MGYSPQLTQRSSPLTRDCSSNSRGETLPYFPPQTHIERCHAERTGLKPPVGLLTAKASIPEGTRDNDVSTRGQSSYLYGYKAPYDGTLPYLNTLLTENTDWYPTVQDASHFARLPSSKAFHYATSSRGLGKTGSGKSRMQSHHP